MDHFIPLAQAIGFKGINADFLEEMLPNPDNPVYLTDGDNILIRNGRIEKLRGSDHLNFITGQRGVGADRRILALKIYDKYTLEKYLLAFTPSQVEYLSSPTGWTDIGSFNGSDESIVSMESMNNKAIFTINDDPTIRYWNGITYGHLVDDAALRARFLTKHKAWLVLARPIRFAGGAWVESHQEIAWSYPGVPGTFDPADKVMIAGSGAINGVRSISESPVIYFPGSIHRVYLIGDTEGFGSVPISETEGLMCDKTLTGGTDVSYFMTKRGFCSLRLGGAPVPLSWSKFNRLIIDGIDPLYYPKAIAQFYESSGLLYVAFPPAGQSDNGTLLIYSVMENELVGKRALTVKHYSAFGLYEKDLTNMTPDARRAYGVGGVPIIGTSDGHVLEERYVDYVQLNNTYVSSMTLPPFFFGDRDRNKRVMQGVLLVEKLTDEDITFEIHLSNEANVTVVTPYTITGTGGAGIRRYEVPMDVFGKEFRPVIKDRLNPYGFRLHGIMFRGYVSTQR